MNKKLLSICGSILLITFFLSSCKKKSVKPGDTETETEITPSKDGTRTQLSLDSIYLYAKEIYYWNTSLPSYSKFNPRQYANMGSGITPLNRALLKLTRYPINPLTGKSYEYYSYNGDTTEPKYSRIETNSSFGLSSIIIKPNNISYIELDGKGTDFGIGLGAVSESDIRIRYVNPSSPAYVAGLKRGDRILTINGRTANASTSAEIDSINYAFNRNNITLTLYNTTKGNFTKSLTQTTYTTSPIMKDTVLSYNSKKVGYLVFARFSHPNNALADLTTSFNKFASAGVTSLIIDLRYNGGGYVDTADDLINLIAPSLLNNKVMYSEYFNDLMQNNKATILQYQPYYDANNKLVSYTKGINGKYYTYADLDYSVSGNTKVFTKKGNLDNIKAVYFIVSGSTASASELTINALKPYLTVKLVGTKTYGKPVGFFGIDIDKYTMYIPNFLSKNANGEGSYFDGMAVDYSASDDITRDFGNTNETCLYTALSYLTGSSVASTSAAKNSSSVLSSTSSPKIIPTGNEFNGMVETRIKLK